MISNEDFFDKTIKQNWGKDGLSVVFDGITNLEKYSKSPIKILWILKEGNERKHEDRNHREFHSCVTWYSGWKSTYKNIILTSYGMLNNCSFEKLPVLDEDAKVNNQYVMDYIALININKNGGGGTANDSVIKANYAKHKEILLQQIHEINPDIIINCSRVSQLFNDISMQYGLTKMKYYSKEFELLVNYAQNSSKLIIDYWHPNVRANIVPVKAYQKQILDIYFSWKNR